ncbi:Signal peptidase complex catalytic subunit S11C [Entophlyctis luteolus]|nr:Signal peptidase complex catalytic subunit S11C [Entophlyctis luteolus]
MKWSQNARKKILTVSGSTTTGKQSFLTKGDHNTDDDRVLYNRNQLWVTEKEVVGRIWAYIPYIGIVTILLSEYPQLKAALLGALGLFVLITKEVEACNVKKDTCGDWDDAKTSCFVKTVFSSARSATVTVHGNAAGGTSAPGAVTMIADEYHEAVATQMLVDPTLRPSDAKRRMPSNNFNDSVAFPPLDSLPYAHNLLDPSANIYYRILDGGSFVRPVRHWCLLAEIIRVDTDASYSNMYARPRVSAVVNVDGCRGVVELNAAQAPQTFTWSDLRPGSTIAVLYAQLQPPLVSKKSQDCYGSMSDGENFPCVWVADLGDVFVFNATMSILRYYAQSITIKSTHTTSLSPQATVVQWLLELMDSRFTAYASFRSCPVFADFLH